jgi:HAD superfamily hydrolase (TIGR01490 family)
LHHKYYAFFDVDNTVVKFKTMRSFLRYFYIQRHPVLGWLLFKKYELSSAVYRYFGRNRVFLNQRYYKQYKGIEEKVIRTACEEWFRSLETADACSYMTIVLTEMEWHKNNGAELVFVSGSFDWCLEPLARKLNVEHVLATHLEVKNGLCTGSISPPQVIGRGKEMVIKDFICRQESKYIKLDRCYAYGDHISDLDMLHCVGNPRVVAGDLELEQYAVNSGWTILSDK